MALARIDKQPTPTDVWQEDLRTSLLPTDRHQYSRVKSRWSKNYE